MRQRLCVVSFFSLLTVAACNSQRWKSEHEHAGKGQANAREQSEEDEEEEEEEDDDVAIEMSAAPAAVQAAASRAIGGAKVEHVYQLGKSVDAAYEIEFSDAGKPCSLTLASDGATIELERGLDESQLPRAVVRAIRTAHPGAQISKSESVQQFYFEIHVTENGRTRPLWVTPNGEIAGAEED